eukprot:jgi/Orpsp1_1/1183801/evm.model.c7180000086755.1
MYPSAFDKKNSGTNSKIISSNDLINFVPLQKNKKEYEDLMKRVMINNGEGLLSKPDSFNLNTPNFSIESAYGLSSSNTKSIHSSELKYARKNSGGSSLTYPSTFNGSNGYNLNNANYINNFPNNIYNYSIQSSDERYSRKNSAG